ncbi:HEAT repeat domain-containing protein [Streptomyces sp. NPDC100445]|uniref:HEAT repeat domain-containing protein n=1 Tax=Streptomyces sp. NPDC100445 TaxID=3366102 RepID=UPI0037FA93E0
MFTGIDEVDWATLRHAHGSAEDVPRWLRALASTDTVERATALDGLYGAVHHQGRVYDSTLACVPFLFALAARPEVPDRGSLVELLVSIGTTGDCGDFGGFGGSGDLTAGVGGGGGGVGGDGRVGGGGDRRGREAVRAGADSFARLASDPDRAVRRAAAGAAVRFLDEPPRTLELLRQRLRGERDERVLLALTEALGLFAHRHPAHADAAVALLAEHSGPPSSPALRLAALGQLALHAPDRLPAGLVPTAIGLSRQRSARRAPTRDHRGPDSLVGRIRRLRPSDEEGAALLRTLHGALGDRVDDRRALLAGQLTSPDPVDRCNAVWMSAGLLRGWRGDHSAVVRLLGAQLDTEDDRLLDAAVSVLAELFALAAPAADDLYALVAARPGLWTHRWERCPPTLGGPLKALTRSGDPRAVPVLAQLLAGPSAPMGLGFEVACLGRAAAPLAPGLRDRLGRIPLDSPTTARLAAPLLAAVGALGDTEAVPELLRLLSDAPGTTGARDAVVGQVVETLTDLGAAAHARPLLRRLLDTRHAAVAAGALWSADGDVDAVLPVLVRESRRTDPVARRHAVHALGRLGPAARPALPGLRRLVRSGTAAERAAAACALWRVTADPGHARPVFRNLWVADPRTRLPIARCLTAMGPAAAPLRDLVTSELAAPRRHLTVGEAPYVGYDAPADSPAEGVADVPADVTYGVPSGVPAEVLSDVPADEELVRLCREVLAALK